MVGWSAEACVWMKNWRARGHCGDRARLPTSRSEPVGPLAHMKQVYPSLVHSCKPASYLERKKSMETHDGESFKGKSSDDHLA